ncbi:MAG: XdhC family protein [Azospirillaceae bacterium]
MKRATLDRLATIRSAGGAAVLVTDLESGEERLLEEAEIDAAAIDQASRDAAQRALIEDKARTIEADGRRLFVAPFNPPLGLIVVGAVHIAQALVPIAAIAGYAVTVVDPRRGFANAERFPGVTLVDDWPDDALTALGINRRTALVTLTHDPKLDDPALDVALRSPAFYIAALGSRRTHAARVERLGALGHDAESIARIHGPAGLDIGAVSPAEIALSVMAEMTAVLRRGRA